MVYQRRFARLSNNAGYSLFHPSHFGMVLSKEIHDDDKMIKDSRWEFSFD